jgi:hypothetical protein
MDLEMEAAKESTVWICLVMSVSKKFEVEHSIFLSKC